MMFQKPNAPRAMPGSGARQQGSFMGPPPQAPGIAQSGSFAPPAPASNPQAGGWASAAMNPSQLFSRIGGMIPQQFQGAYNQGMQNNPLAQTKQWPGAGNAPQLFGPTNPMIAALMGRRQG